MPRIIVVTQHYPPDTSTTATIMSAIAEHLAREHQVIVLSGSPRRSEVELKGRPVVFEIRNRMAAKAALVKRLRAEALFTMRVFCKLLATLQRGDVALTVTAPFGLPYAVALASSLKRARSALIMHDLYPDVLVMAGLLNANAIVTRAIRRANALLFRALDAVITIGRDTERLLLRYPALTPTKLRFIPNWATLSPGVRPIRPDNPYRPCGARFVVGLSGNLGFTHDPHVVFQAAQLLRNNPDVAFILSGWGVGFEKLKRLQAEANLPNVTLVGRVEDNSLEQFLSAANVWLIPYRKNMVGVSVPSRFYNLLAIGRPVILVSEQDAEAAITISENNLGWVVTPESPGGLAEAIELASKLKDPGLAERAVVTASGFSEAQAMRGYSDLMKELLRASKPERRLA